MIKSTLIHKFILDGENDFYIKREDLLPFSFGGNKARKALYFLEDINKHQANAIVTYGSSSSNHCRVIANMAVSMGMKCYIVSPEEDYHSTYNSRLLNLMGAVVIKTPIENVSRTIDKTLNNLQKNSRPYFIPGGGHGNLGTRAYVDAYDEICEYEQKTGMSFDYIFHASGTGTTQAGLVVGMLKKKNYRQKIVGISVARKNLRGTKIVHDSVVEYLSASGINHSDIESFIHFDDRYICGGYGKYNQNVSRIVKDVFCKNGIALNTTYTGKALYGMQEVIEERKITGKKILFINTGGTPLFFDSLKDIG